MKKTTLFNKAILFGLVPMTFAACAPAGNSGQGNYQSSLEQDENTQLFTEVSDQAAPQNVLATMAANNEEEQTTLNERLVRVDFALLKRTANQAAIRSLTAERGTELQKIRLNLFDGVDMQASIDSVQPLSETNAILSGQIVGEEDSSVTLVMNDDVLIANVRRGSAHQAFEVRYVADGLHTIRSLDPEAETTCDSDYATDGEVDNAIAPDAIQLMATPIIDVIVGYTPNARSRQGGTKAMQALIQSGIADTNRAFENSGVNAKVRLVHMVEVKQNETGNWSRDLTSLKGKTDGRWDELHKLRDQYGADQISLVGAYSSSRSTAGIGYVRAASTSAVTVTRAAAFGQYTFSHELGHNIGLNHSDGLQNLSGGFRTIMAYGSKKRIARYSNPNRPYNGYKTGDSRHNSAKILNANVARVAGFRAAKN